MGVCLSTICGPCGAGFTKHGNNNSRAVKTRSSSPLTTVLEPQVVQEPEREPATPKNSAPTTPLALDTLQGPRVSNTVAKISVSEIDGGLDPPSFDTMDGSGSARTSASSWYELEDDGCEGCIHLLMILSMAVLLLWLIVFLAVTWGLSSLLYYFGGVSFSTSLIVALIVAVMAVVAVRERGTDVVFAWLKSPFSWPLVFVAALLYRCTAIAAKHLRAFGSLI